MQIILGPYQSIFPQFRHSAPSFCKACIRPWWPRHIPIPLSNVSAPPPGLLLPNEITLCTEVYGEPLFFESQSAGPAHPWAHLAGPSFWKFWLRPCQRYEFQRPFKSYQAIYMQMTPRFGRPVLFSLPGTCGLEPRLYHFPAGGKGECLLTRAHVDEFGLLFQYWFSD